MSNGDCQSWFTDTLKCLRSGINRSPWDTYGTEKMNRVVLTLATTNSTGLTLSFKKNAFLPLVIIYESASSGAFTLHTGEVSFTKMADKEWVSWNYIMLNPFIIRMLRKWLDLEQEWQVCPDATDCCKNKSKSYHRSNTICNTTGLSWDFNSLLNVDCCYLGNHRHHPQYEYFTLKK